MGWGDSPCNVYSWFHAQGIRHGSRDSNGGKQDAMVKPYPLFSLIVILTLVTASSVGKGMHRCMHPTVLKWLGVSWTKYVFYHMNSLPKSWLLRNVYNDPNNPKKIKHKSWGIFINMGLTYLFLCVRWTILPNFPFPLFPSHLDFFPLCPP